MIRLLHRWPGLLAAALLIVLAMSGAALSVFPAWERLTAPNAAPEQTVAQLAALVLANHPGVEQIKRAPSGKITAWWFEGDTAGAAVIDPVTGRDVASADQSRVEQWLTTLHRSLFLDDGGRIVMAGAALALLTLALSGAVLVARRVGGWHRWFGVQRGPLAGRIHTEVARVAVPALALSALTALWMVASTFDLLPMDDATPRFPTAVSGLSGADPLQIATFAATPLTDLRGLTFPTAGDATDVFTLTTAQGTGYLDQGTGALLEWATPGLWTRIGAWIYLLHTGQGAALWGLALGLMVLTIPVLAVSGTLRWIAGRQAGGTLRGMVTAQKAQTIILVGSEGGTTWGFAKTLGAGLQAAGQSVHLAPLSSFAPHSYTKARQIVVMAATWGDGAAPTLAQGALARLAASRPTVPMAILGFGDSSFPAFCAYARAFAATARSTGWEMLCETGQIDRQSVQAFARWGQAFGTATGVPLALAHQVAARETVALRLLSRRDYGEAVQAPMAILRFALPRVSLWRRLTGRAAAGFVAGDLLGIVPDGDIQPRYYSLASARRDGFMEIAVRKLAGGRCSTQLLALQPGQSMDGFVQTNPGFHLDHSKAPVVLIGAGTGVGPLAGFIRAQGARRPVHLWFGIRDPKSDMLFDSELALWSDTGRLAGLHTAASRSGRKHYVQDLLRQDAEALRGLIAGGARVMVCGGRDMAQGVRDVLGDILAPIGMSAASLHRAGRYAEDVY